MKLRNLAVIGAAAAALTLAVPASAAGAGAAVFTGATGTLSGTGVLAVGGAGGYTFNTSGTIATIPVVNVGVSGGCAAVGAFSKPAVAVGATVDGVSINGGCNLSATGNYTNIVCGTGFAPGSSTITYSQNVTPTVADQLVVNNYTLIFIAGQGVVVAAQGVVNSSPNATQPLAASITDSNTGFSVEAAVAGYVNILPIQGNCVTAPVTQFLASGVVVVAGA